MVPGKIRISLSQKTKFYLFTFYGCIVMRKLLLALIGALALSSAAHAQGANWSGFTAGISGGFGSGSAGQNLPPALITEEVVITDHKYGLSGGVLGLGGAYDMQTGPWVYGVLFDYSWANIDGLTTVTTCAPLGCGVELRSFGTLRGRIGYAYGTWLPYITGGLAFGNVHAFNNNIPASGSQTHVGWTLGVGIATKFAPNWSAKLEYLYADLGKKDHYFVAPGIPEAVGVRTNIVRVGIDYHFAPVAPAPAPLYRK